MIVEMRQCDECHNKIEEKDYYYSVKIERMSKIGENDELRETLILDLCPPCIRKCCPIAVSKFKSIPAQIDSHVTRLGCSICGVTDGPHLLNCTISDV